MISFGMRNVAPLVDFGVGFFELASLVAPGFGERKRILGRWYVRRHREEGRCRGRDATRVHGVFRTSSVGSALGRT